MNWYKKAQGGEWWFIDGQAVLADSNTGDMGHEAYVLENVRHDIAEEMYYNHYDFEMNDWDETKKEIIRNLVKTDVIPEKPLIKKYGEDYLEKIPYNADIFDEIATGMGVDKLKLDVADNTVDPRDYGMQVLGWKRVVGNHVQTQTLSPDDLKNIDNGLYDAYGNQGDGDDMNKYKYTIEVMATRKLYSDIPYEVIGEHNPSKIANYGGAYSPYAYAKSNHWYKKAKTYTSKEEIAKEFKNLYPNKP